MQFHLHLILLLFSPILLGLLRLPVSGRNDPFLFGRCLTQSNYRQPSKAGCRLPWKYVARSQKINQTLCKYLWFLSLATHCLVCYVCLQGEILAELETKNKIGKTWGGDLSINTSFVVSYVSLFGCSFLYHTRANIWSSF